MTFTYKCTNCSTKNDTTTPPEDNMLHCSRCGFNMLHCSRCGFITVQVFHRIAARFREAEKERKRG